MKLVLQPGRQCPHCRQYYFAEAPDDSFIGRDGTGEWRVRTALCPACNRLTITLLLYHPGKEISTFRRQVIPPGTHRPPLPPEVPQEFAGDYLEACEVLPSSAKASAALSRRCLQHLLREQAKVKAQELAKEIEEVLASKSLPSHIAEIVDAIRNYGNFSTHPIKDAQTGSVIDVEEGEAEWLLEILEALFDWYFVQPAKWQQKKAALNQKLAQAGKLPMKS